VYFSEAAVGKGFSIIPISISINPFTCSSTKQKKKRESLSQSLFLMMSHGTKLAIFMMSLLTYFKGAASFLTTHSGLGGCLSRPITTINKLTPHDYVSNNKSTPQNKVVYDKGTVFPTNAIAAVSVVLCRQAKAGSIEFLLVKRRKEPGKGKWSLPGGSIRVGEPTVQAAARELEEETGINIQEVKLSASAFMTTDAIYTDKKEGRIKFHYVISQVFGWTGNNSLHIQALDDAAAAAWFTPELLGAMGPSDFAGNIEHVIERANTLVLAGCFEEVIPNLENYSGLPAAVKQP